MTTPPAKTKAKKAHKARHQQSRRARVMASATKHLPLWRERAGVYSQLMRVEKPVGTLLLLWPALWSLWLAGDGKPSNINVVIFVLGAFLMRSAGCVINDYADRRIDGLVLRTKGRPFPAGKVREREALALFGGLCVVAFLLVLFTNHMTILLSFGGALLAACYPFAKRYLQMPQAVLGAAFAWAVPMAFAAQRGKLDEAVWLIYVAVVLWALAYDTFYAMVDRDDDLKAGIKSSAILFADSDLLVTRVIQCMVLGALALAGGRFHMGAAYYGGLGLAASCFVWQQWLIRDRDRAACMRAFLHNQWVGAAIFAGIALDYYLRVSPVTH